MDLTAASTAALSECFASCSVPLVHTDLVGSLQRLNEAIRRKDCRCQELSQRLNAVSAKLGACGQIVRRNEELECTNVDLASANTLLTLSNARLQKLLAQHERNSGAHLLGKNDVDAKMLASETNFGLVQELVKDIENISLSLQHKRNSIQSLDRELNVSYDSIKSLRSTKPDGWQAQLCCLRSKHRQLAEQARSRQRDIQHEERQLQKWIQLYLDKKLDPPNVST